MNNLNNLSDLGYKELNDLIVAVKERRYQANKDHDEILWNQLYALGSKLETEAERRAQEAGYKDVAQKMFNLNI